MVKRKVRARTAGEARRKAKERWPGRVITGVRLYKKQKDSEDGKKSYRVLSRKKSTSKSKGKYMNVSAHRRKGTENRSGTKKMLRSLHNPKRSRSQYIYPGRRIH